MIIFSLYLLMAMLVVGGMAVDFMQFEERRAKVQSVADRAALAAANIRNEKDPVEVVADFFEKAGLSDYLDGDAIVTGSGKTRRVEVNTTMDMDTSFLGLLGIDTLETVGGSIATQGINSIEVSLVLDISGSMDAETYDSSGAKTGTKKIEALRSASVAFIDELINEETENLASLSIVPYAQHVNVGSDIFNALYVDRKHYYSECVEFNDPEFSTTAINTYRTYEQGQRVQILPHKDDKPAEAGYDPAQAISRPACPEEWYEEITPISQDEYALKRQVRALQPQGATSIYLGLKWGLGLLDPSMRYSLSVDSAFRDRPQRFLPRTDPDYHTKVLVLMTDGANITSRYIKPEYYETPSMVGHWAENTTEFFFHNYFGTAAPDKKEFIYRRFAGPKDVGRGTDGTDADAITRSLCNAARDNGIIMYTIAYEAEPEGEALMNHCATSPSHYFNATGGDLTDIFTEIGSNITQLRLVE
jgi:Flp pilus assembly protein TadG